MQRDPVPGPKPDPACRIFVSGTYLWRRWGIYFFKMLWKHLAVQADGHLMAVLWWQWWVLVTERTEKYLGLFQLKREHRSCKVYVSRVSILPALPRWVTLALVHQLGEHQTLGRRGRSFGAAQVAACTFRGSPTRSYSQREPVAGRCDGRLRCGRRKQNKDLTRLVRRKRGHTKTCVFVTTPCEKEQII